MNEKIKKYLAILALGVSGGSIYLLPYLKYVFYDQQIAAMGITNQQSGLLISMYAIGNVILYIPGGILADKLSAKKCILFSLISTTLLTILYGITLSYSLALVIWLLLSITTVLVFWASLIKTISIIGSEEEQARIFGVYYAVNGITGAISNAIALWACNLGTTERASLFNVTIVYSVITAIAALMIALFIKNDESIIVKKSDKDSFKLNMAVTLLKDPIVWIFSIIIFCGYSIYSSTSYFVPYLTSVIGISQTESGIYSIIRNYLFMLLAPVSGYIADKIFKSTSKWIMTGFIILTLLFFGIFLIPIGINATFISIYTLLPGAFALAVYGIEFSVLGETKIPEMVTGTVIGIASVIGYLPDLFMNTMFGTWIDKYGKLGYNYIFIYEIVICVIGFIAAYLVRRFALTNYSIKIQEEIAM